MGFKNFYKGFKTTFETCIGKTPKEENHNVMIIELNGLFYNSCRKLSEYQGTRRRKEINLYLFEKVCENLHTIIQEYHPTQKLLLVVDGVSGMMKNIEQRQRRYKNSLENKYGDLVDLNSFSPGSNLLHFMTKYIDWFLKIKMMNDKIYQNLEIYFSNEKVPGEGEVKLFHFIRKRCTLNDRILIYSCDSDVILLSLLLEPFSITIVRNSTIHGIEFVNVTEIREQMYKKFSHDKTETKSLFWMDMFVLFLLLGNDYLPASPCVYSFSILEKKILPEYQKQKRLFFNQKYELQILPFCEFLSTIGQHEKIWLVEKYDKEENSYYPDIIYRNDQSPVSFDFKTYKKHYNHLNMIDHNSVTDYLQTIQNVMNMIFQQNFDWLYFYPNYKSPFLSDFICNEEMEKNYRVKINSTHSRSEKFMFEPVYHSLTVLPPHSRSLLPIPFQNVFQKLHHYYPSYIEIDLTGKCKLWEGVLKLPILSPLDYMKYYNEQKQYLSKEEHKRNIVGKTFLYLYREYSWYDFYSYYGNIENCKIRTNLLEI